MKSKEVQAAKIGALFSSEWYATLGSAYVKYAKEDEYSLAEIDFILNGEISPFTRFMMVFASYNHAQQEISKLNKNDRERIKRELKTYIQPEKEFSGRLWMQVALLEFMAKTPAPTLQPFIASQEYILQLSQELHLTQEQQDILWSIHLKVTQFEDDYRQKKK
jgi:hypothetical protein